MLDGGGYLVSGEVVHQLGIGVGSNHRWSKEVTGRFLRSFPSSYVGRFSWVQFSSFKLKIWHRAYANFMFTNMLMLFPNISILFLNMSIVLEQIHYFRTSIIAELTELSFKANSSN